MAMESVRGGRIFIAPNATVLGMFPLVTRQESGMVP